MKTSIRVANIPAAKSRALAEVPAMTTRKAIRGPGQRAMLHALLYPEATNKGGRGKKTVPPGDALPASKQHVSRARAIIGNEDQDGDQKPGESSAKGRAVSKWGTIWGTGQGEPI
jgi:hypothetical protein